MMNPVLRFGEKFLPVSNSRDFSPGFEVCRNLANKLRGVEQNIEKNES